MKFSTIFAAGAMVAGAFAATATTATPQTTKATASSRTTPPPAAITTGLCASLARGAPTMPDKVSTYFTSCANFCNVATSHMSKPVKKDFTKFSSAQNSYIQSALEEHKSDITTCAFYAQYTSMAPTKCPSKAAAPRETGMGAVAVAAAAIVMAL